jgi:hypothetical protein
MSSGHDSKAYPDIFSNAGWIEASDERDLLFVCLPAQQEIRIFDISKPMEDIPLLGKFETGCSRSGSHDYRVLDYKDHVTGRYKSVLVDPANAGNMLYYYDTDDPSKPRLVSSYKAVWEARDNGMGQVRPGGPRGPRWPGGELHLITWHCSKLYCGKNHGDSVYIVNYSNLNSQAIRVGIPHMEPGAFGRDLACGKDGVCLVSLTWNGLVALDSGVEGSKNAPGIVAASDPGHPFMTEDIPRHIAHLRLYSGAQKIYASQRHSRHFYVEHADFSLRPLRVGDTLRALQLNQVYLVEVVDYDASVALPYSALTVSVPSPSPVDIEQSEDVSGANLDSDERRDDSGTIEGDLTFVALALLCIVLCLFTILVVFMIRTRQASSRQQELSLQQHEAAFNAGRAAAERPLENNENVVLGRPVENGNPSDEKLPVSVALGPPKVPQQDQKVPQQDPELAKTTTEDY